MSGINDGSAVLDLTVTQRFVSEVHAEALQELSNEANSTYQDKLSIFEKWLQGNNNEGYYIKDLDLVGEIIGKLHLLLQDDFCVFQDILTGILELCSLPLMESKANERLSAKGFDKMKGYFCKLALLWDISDFRYKIKTAKCFRCIMHCGKDPTILQSAQREWISDGKRLVVDDPPLIQKLIRECGLIGVIVTELTIAADTLHYDTSFINKSVVHKETDDMSVDNNSPQTAQNMQADLEYFGLIASQNNGSDESKGSQVVEDNNSIREAQPQDFSNEKEIVDPSTFRELTKFLLDLALDISEDTENAAVMCAMRVCDGAAVLIEKDFKYDSSDVRISYSVELMWNSLERYLQKHKATVATDPSRANELATADVMDYETVIRILRVLLEHLIVNGFRLSDRECRNEVLIVLSFLAEFKLAIPCFIQSGILNLLMTYACVEEMGLESWYYFNSPLANSRNFSLLSDIDMEFKKELWMLITAVLKESNDPDALLCFASSPMLACMLHYLEHDSFELNKKNESMYQSGGGESPPAELLNFSASFTAYSSVMEKESFPMGKNGRLMSGSVTGGRGGEGTSSPLIKTGLIKEPYLSTFPIGKLREFQLQAVTFLIHNAPRVLGEYERLDGIPKIMLLCVKYSLSEVEEHRNLVFNSLVLLNRCLIQSRTVRAYMEDNNAVQTFLYLFEKSWGLEETQAQAIRLISTLCSGSNRHCQAQFLSLNGIRSVMKPMITYVQSHRAVVGAKAGISLHINESQQQLQDPLENPYGGEISVLVVAVLDCLSKAVVGNGVNEAQFADEEGVDVVLDLLETTPFVLRIQVLRFVSNLLVNRRLTSFVNAWRSSKTLRSAAQICCHCWMDEEARLNSTRVSDGVIGDIWNPLGQHEWPATSLPPAPVPVVLPPKDIGNQTSKDGIDIPQRSVQLEGDDYGSAYMMVNADGSDAMGGGGNGLMQGSTVTATSNATQTKTASLAVTRLATAILAGRNTSQSNLPSDVCDQVLEKDTRVILANILHSLGVYEMYGIRDQRNPLIKLADSFLYTNEGEKGEEDGQNGYTFGSNTDAQVMAGSSASPMAASTTGGFGAGGDLGLTAADKQVLSLAKKYDALREGEWWNQVKLSVQNAGVVPIEADLAWMDHRLEYSFDAAQAVQMEQMELIELNQQAKESDEKQFIDQIIVKKDQQIKAEWLKRNGRTNRANNKQSVLKTMESL